MTKMIWKPIAIMPEEFRNRLPFFWLLALLVLPVPPAQAGMQAVTPDTAEGTALVERIRGGGYVLYFRHADTAGMPCDSGYVIGEREGQRNLSEAGRLQSMAIGEALAALAVPIARPVLAGPVYRARDTAELAFGIDDVSVVEGLTADDYAGGNLGHILNEHRRMMNEPPRAGTNTALFGHRTPAIMVIGPAVAGDAFPEGAALVLQPRRQAGGDAPPTLHGILHLTPTESTGFHDC